MIRLLQTLIILFIVNPVSASDVHHKLHAIELEHHLKIGVYALDTNNGRVVAHHATDKFPFQSTCKFIGASALLAKDESLLQKKVLIHPQEILPWHPISGLYVGQYVTLKILAEAAVSYSDNSAINRIIHELGGLKAVNQFAHSIGNASFTMNHYEIHLNSNPNKETDTSTPQDMALSIQKILLGTVLSNPNKALLLEWMRNNTTGYKRIRAGVPLGWSVADKTGTGSYGIANNIGIAWSPTCKPIVLSVFTMSDQPNAKPSDEVIAKTTRVLFEEFEQHDACYHATRLT